MLLPMYQTTRLLQKIQTAYASRTDATLRAQGARADAVLAAEPNHPAALALRHELGSVEALAAAARAAVERELDSATTTTPAAAASAHGDGDMGGGGNGSAPLQRRPGSKPC